MNAMHTTHKHQTGLTLVEIMVAMVISLILLAGVLQIFQANKQSFLVQESLARIQENGRAAMRILAEDLRMADFWGCTSQEIEITDNLNAGGTGYVDLLVNGGISGTNGTGTSPDSITIEGARSAGISVSAAMPNVAAALPVTSGAGLQQGDILLVTDCTQGDIMQITNNSPATSNTVVHNAGSAVDPGNSTANLSRIYDTNAMAFQARQTTYSIAADPDSGEPSLFRTENGAAVELVEGIEDMQIEYGELLNAISGTMRYVNAGVGSLNMNQVQSVRITLVARSDAASVAIGGDGRLRRTFSNTISIRNRNP
jgi:type IV pilus assembly protein PilW